MKKNFFVHPIRKHGPLIVSDEYSDTKDPCIVFDGQMWHIFGSGGSSKKESWGILHATSPTIEGPWTVLKPVQMGLKGPHVAAPGVVYDHAEKKFHMAVQEDFTRAGSSIHYLVSKDGDSFEYVSEILSPIPGTGEAGLYDPHFSLVHGRILMVYSGMPSTVPGGRPFTPQPDIYLAESETGLWAGPWKRLGKILDHEDIAWHHNRRDAEDYEWGIEGPQLAELPDSRVVLNSTCFLENGPRGTRQRVFFATALKPEGPYESLGPVLTDSAEEWENGENGHASVFMHESLVYLFYQARPFSPVANSNNNWKYGTAVFDASLVPSILQPMEEERAKEEVFV